MIYGRFMIYDLSWRLRRCRSKSLHVLLLPMESQNKPFNKQKHLRTFTTIVQADLKASGLSDVCVYQSGRRSKIQDLVAVEDYTVYGGVYSQPAHALHGALS